MAVLGGTYDSGEARGWRVIDTRHRLAVRTIPYLQRWYVLCAAFKRVCHSIRLNLLETGKQALAVDVDISQDHF